MTKKRLTLEDACAIARNQVSHTIEDARQIAISRNGKCLSTKYINSYSHLLWRCSKGLEFLASLHHVKISNSWCSKCAKVARHSIKIARQIAISRNGDCISTIYYNNHSALLWRCENNYYIFTATLNAIKNQHTWCPFCSKKREDLCRKIITKYLGLPSRIRKPDFLKTPKYPTGLKLDIPYYDYGFAIEVQGIQHERQIKFFHPNFEDFEKQQTRDQLKEELCEENWIALRYVWYYEDPFEKILDILRELGLIS
ncbi:5317_t:CDS:2 [Racocetra fulgida]|uniref:5317_t:CDS:1 n=1 Tax=Racocetra fulgida TaxID=60492 RepID=A0A9N9IBF3_9GLOM|nr:5317_t:CDS:2 [Racocetra fulgida]